MQPAAPRRDSLARQERRFALALLAPALAVLALTTTVPLVYLAWTALNRIDLSMPWLTGFVGSANTLFFTQSGALCGGTICITS